MKGIVGCCLIILAVFLLLPVFTVLFYDGFGKIPQWPGVFFILAASGVFLIGLGGWVLFSHKRVGAEVFFETGGFRLELRSLFRRERSYSLTWSDIESVKLIVAPRGGDLLAFRLTPAAAVKHGLILPSTRYTASKKLVKREVSMSINLCSVSLDEAFKRFEASAHEAGAKLVAASSFNAFIFQHKVWTVAH